MSSFDHCSDAELVGQCNTGHREDAIRAYETLYRRHKDYVLRVSLRYLHDTDLALDVLQDTFAWLLSRFPPPGEGLHLTAQLNTLLYTVAKNNALTILRKNCKLDTTADFDPDSYPGPQQTNSEIAALMNGLSPRQREVISLRFVDDLPLADIAEILGIRPGTVKSRLHGAIQVLRNSLYVKDFFDK